MWGMWCLTQGVAPAVEQGSAPPEVLSKLAPKKHGRSKGSATPSAAPAAAAAAPAPAGAAAPAAAAGSAPSTKTALALAGMALLKKTADEEAEFLANAAVLKASGILTTPELEEEKGKSKKRIDSAKKKTLTAKNSV